MAVPSGAVLPGPSWFTHFVNEHDQKLFCPSCGVRPGTFHRDNCEQSTPVSIWEGPKDTPAMLLVELVESDMRLKCTYCMKCDGPLLMNGVPSKYPERRRIFLTRHGFGIHVDCVLELSREIMAPAEAVSEEFEARRRAFLEA